MSKWSKQRISGKQWRCPVPTCQHHRPGNELGSGAALGAHWKSAHAQEWSYDPDTGKATNVALAVPAVRGAQREADRIGFLQGAKPAVNRAMQEFEQRQQELTALRDSAERKEILRPTAVEATTAILNLPEVASLSSQQLAAIMEHVCAIKAIDEKLPMDTQSLDDLDKSGFDTQGVRSALTGHRSRVNHMPAPAKERELVEA